MPWAACNSSSTKFNAIARSNQPQRSLTATHPKTADPDYSMPETPLSVRRQLQLLQQLQEHADERAHAEREVAETLEHELTSAEKDFTTTKEKLTEDFAGRRRKLENDFAAAKKRANDTLQETQTRLQNSFKQNLAKCEATYKQTALAIERKKKESEWQALAVFDAAKDEPQQMLNLAAKRLLATRNQVDGLQRDTNTLLAMRHLTSRAGTVEPVTADSPESPTDQTAEQQQQENLNRLHQSVLTLQSQLLPSVLLEGIRPWGWAVTACVIATIASGFSLGWSWWQTPLVGVVGGGALAGALGLLLGRQARRQTLEQCAKILGLLQQARDLEEAAQEQARERSRQEAQRINQQKHDDLAAAQAARDQAAADNAERKRMTLAELQDLLDKGLATAQQEYETAIEAAEKKFPPLLDQLAAEREAAHLENEERYQQRKSTAQQNHENQWTALAERWQAGFQAIADQLSAMQAECERLFPDWSQTEWQAWQRPTEPPAAMKFGSYELPLTAVKNGVSGDPRLQPEQKSFHLPALMPLGELPRLAITAAGAGCVAAAATLRAMMFRFLTTMPAGKLRFTIIDPTGLGENFSALMHLADFDEQLVGQRIWTDSRQIDERLGLLADHMEKVLQKYLRNDYATLQEYNAQAGEVAEPYHVLVVANFPSGLSDAALRKLQTLATAGPRCGVYTMVSIDTSVRLPHEYDIAPLLEGAVHLKWQKDQFVWKYPLFEKLPLQLDHLPPSEKLTSLLQAAGEESRVASIVEVPFEVVAPPSEQIWQGSTAHELVVPIGRAGAKELQSLRLGRGTSQHALISGKTGSGKSTLLHALITNAALHYSPDELELYLVDFKKGVEFKAYAAGQLPHARVIAIESEREFGVSVLERLDEELRMRGEVFRELGVQDLAGYRAKRSESRADDPSNSLTSHPFPRVLLIVDEFQELFVVDDKLAQDAALLLDRLVRQGRAFGIHVLLGSQTLGGAYSLARSTIGQMAVRIALECSDADAHLILSDENTAAKLLSRPGEAIYNDQNGLVEGNSPFQVVWLPDSKRRDYLQTIRERTAAKYDPSAAPPPAIVFEGNVPANPQDNSPLSELLTSSDSITTEPTLWLGSAVRIGPPTQLTLRRQSGNNVLIVGQEEPLGLGMLTTAVVAATAQLGGEGPAVTVIDGTRPESKLQGLWQEVVQTLGNCVELGKPAEVARVIGELTEEVAKRSASTEQSFPTRLLVLHDLAQIRSLRMTEDEFSFSSSKNGKPTPLDKQFRNLLREGPGVGVHVLLWCDSYNGMTRYIDRLTLREIDFRIAMQMSTADSTSLIDSPAAGRIGEQRAVFYRDDLGSSTKFRPYGRPTAEWLVWLAEQARRAPAMKP